MNNIRYTIYLITKETLIIETKTMYSAPNSYTFCLPNNVTYFVERSNISYMKLEVLQ